MGGILRSTKKRDGDNNSAANMKSGKMARIGSFVDLSRGANMREAEERPHILDNGGGRSRGGNRITTAPFQDGGMIAPPSFVFSPYILSFALFNALLLRKAITLASFSLFIQRLIVLIFF